MSQITLAELEERLLSYFSKVLSVRDIAYIQPPVLLREGRILRTYKFRMTGVPKEYSKMLILRLFDAEELPVRPLFEEILHNTLNDQGLPVPRVYFAESSVDYLTAPFLIMEEVRGESLFDINSVNQKPYMQAARFLISGVGSVARELASVALQLHSVTTDQFHEKLKSLKFPIEHLSLNGRLYQLYKRVQNTKLTGLEPGIIWLISHGPPDPVKPSLCHGQLYPNNIRKKQDLVDGIINWSMDSIVFGDPAFDIGRTSAAFKCFVPYVTPALMRLSFNVGNRFARQFVNAYRQKRAVSKDKIRYYELMWCMDLAASAGESMTTKSHIYKKEFDEARVDLYKSTANAIEYFKSETGIPVMIPFTRN